MSEEAQIQPSVARKPKAKYPDVPIPQICPQCGKRHIVRCGIVTGKWGFKFQQVKCQECGYRFYGNVVQVPTENVNEYLQLRINYVKKNFEWFLKKYGDGGGV